MQQINYLYNMSTDKKIPYKISNKVNVDGKKEIINWNSQPIVCE